MSYAPNRSLLKDVDIQTLYQMRNEGMTNKQIADKVGVSYQTILKHIGKQPQNERDEHVTVSVKPVKKRKKNNDMIPSITKHDSFVLQFECKQVVADGKLCKYTIDIGSRTVTMSDGVINGTLDIQQLQTIVFELKECLNKLSLC